MNELHSQCALQSGKRGDYYVVNEVNNRRDCHKKIR